MLLSKNAVIQTCLILHHMPFRLTCFLIFLFNNFYSIPRFLYLYTTRDFRMIPLFPGSFAVSLAFLYPVLHLPIYPPSVLSCVP